MKKMLILLAVLMIFSGINATALFVIDEYTTYQNYQTVQLLLQRNGLVFSVYNINEQGSAPQIEILNEYDLVVWYCSHSGVDLGFWNGNDTDNLPLKTYLDGGGRLWLMGSDILYDRYGSAPDSFDPGTFVYDYLGISSYICQSYADDGSTGLPRLNATVNTYIPNLPDLTWIYPTSWYVDGLIPTPTAVPIYQMGPASYLLHGNASAILLPPVQPATDKAVLGFYFDPYEIGVEADADTLFYHVIQYFESLNAVDNADVHSPNLQMKLTNFPNPFSTDTTLSFDLLKASNLEIKVYNLKGQLVNSLFSGEKASGTHQITWNPTDDLPQGIYLIQAKSEGKVVAQKKVLYR